MARVKAARVILSILAVLALLCGSASPVAAASAFISPATQSHAHGVASHWTLTWGGYSPYEVLFDRGNGTGVYWASTSSTSSSQSYTFRPCYTTNFHQYLDIWDSHGNHAGDDSHAQESGGSPC